ncbi:Lon protease 2 [bioreactor metagenome]|jgi:ATP-dependent Lon protease|uniref:endopeptidase La n=1 Tax=bioreactor metagenome TaxID=1076179 RepID=A0A644UAS8_9ZZZZ|nr:endopeptidase La [Lentimicrobium sp.]MEA5111529.1 endopeptidase La [Lentimicrobium sp.]
MTNEGFGFTELIENETEFIPLLSTEDEEQMNAEEVPETLPILPLRNTVLFPGVVIPITVGRDKSIRLIKDYYKGNRIIGAVAQKDVDIEDPSFKDLNEIGTIAYIIKLLQMPDGSTTAIIQGKKRFRILEMLQDDPYFIARVNQFDKVKPLLRDKKFNALISSVKDLAIQIINLSPNLPSDSVFAIRNIESPVFLVNFISSNLNISLEEKQKLLAIDDLIERANMVLGMLTRELQIIELKNQIQSKVKIDLDKQQRDYLLNQQLKTIQEELGDNPHTQEISDLREKAAKKRWPENVAEVFEKELTKLQRMNPAAMEYSMQLNYLEVLTDLPWNEFTVDNFDLKHAQKVLDKDHYGLETVKERIIEYLAVLKLKGDMKSPILCLFGPPGVGKTSLGKSVARAVNRNYIRMSLGGLRDEAEIRGHRKTYIGAMPGRILQSIKKAKASNPVFVLDEIDKVIGANINGDPSAALLEVLDPEQNNTFYDNFVELEYDLSKVMFIATANNLSTIHPALRDRMEVIEITGYLLEEKIEIARRHLVPKQLNEHGVKPGQLEFDKKIIELIIDAYTRESGVRELEKKIAKIIRHQARFIVTGDSYNLSVTAEDVHKILGPARFSKEKDETPHAAGVVTGLAWTPVGGEILYVETSLSRGKGNMGLTGNLGDVMKESATLAFEYLKSHSDQLGLEPSVFEKWNVHLHVPEGATPKDGPSAGITMFTALASAFTQRLIKPRLAMTGEITLRGKVLPVGGIKEKILAARRAGIKEIILPTDNKKDIEEIKQVYLKGLKIHYVEQMIDVLDLALLEKLASNPLKINY